MLGTGEVPPWVITGRTVSIIKDMSVGNTPRNYRPITCLALRWKLLTGIIFSQLYQHLEREPLIIDKMAIKHCKGRKTYLAMPWIDYKKTSSNESLGGIESDEEFFPGDSLSPLLFVTAMIR